jgi:dTDP-4-dehydrorhamnose 3,5-epimerase
MEYLKTPKFIKGNAFYDERGVFVPLSLTSHVTWLQSNISVNLKPFTLRGLHFQQRPYQQSKLIKVINGSIIDFITNLDPASEDFLKIKIFTMDPGDELYVPQNYAHGFITLKENTVVQYLVNNIYNSNSEGVIPWTEFPELLELFKKIENFSVSNIVIKDRDLVRKNFDILKRA